MGKLLQWLQFGGNASQFRIDQLVIVGEPAYVVRFWIEPPCRFDAGEQGLECGLELAAAAGECFRSANTREPAQPGSEFRRRAAQIAKICTFAGQVVLALLFGDVLGLWVAKHP